MNRVLKVVVSLVVAASLVACTSTATSTQPERAQQVLLLDNAEQVYLEWRDKLEDIESLSIYSPATLQSLNTLWARVESNYKEFDGKPERLHATSFFGSETYYSRFQADISQIERLYDELMSTQKAADIALRPATEHLHYLDEIEAREYFRSEYDRLKRFYERLYVIFDEQGEAPALKQQKEFLIRARSLEVKTIKRIYITPLEDISRELRRRDARSFVPESFAAVDKAIADAKNLIDDAPRAFELIDKAVNDISFQLAHATHMLEAVVHLRGLSRDSYEAYILDMEKHLLALSMALNGKDYRNLDLVKQVETILTDIREQNAQIEALKKQLEALQK
ncbi:hypothetical protein [Thaumasiovibrio subtropicus]|uniref:hypothetical protein n=1 Tax=Thaumasiovibrio subtropicus TaxID=1891207 RepID=UPI000B35A0BE|nr:hypothetical protein [Thaumasiovibrio subtropicus]